MSKFNNHCIRVSDETWAEWKVLAERQGKSVTQALKMAMAAHAVRPPIGLGISRDAGIRAMNQPFPTDLAGIVAKSDEFGPAGIPDALATVMSQRDGQSRPMPVVKPLVKAVSPVVQDVLARHGIVTASEVPKPVKRSRDADPAYYEDFPSMAEDFSE